MPITLDYHRGANEAAFTCAVVRAAAEDRVERRIMAEADARQLVPQTAESVEQTSARVLAEVADANENLVEAKRPARIQEAAERALRALDIAAVPGERRHEAALATKNNAFPSPRYTFEGREASIPAEDRARYERLLNRLEREPLKRQREIILECARRGDFEPFIAVKFFAPDFISHEIFDDERFMAQLTEIFLDAAGVRHEVESGLMAASMCALMVEKGRQVVFNIAGKPSSRREPLLSLAPDGSMIERARPGRSARFSDNQADVLDLRVPEAVHGGHDR